MIRLVAFGHVSSSRVSLSVSLSARPGVRSCLSSRFRPRVSLLGFGGWSHMVPLRGFFMFKVCRVWHCGIYLRTRGARVCGQILSIDYRFDL